MHLPGATEAFANPLDRAGLEELLQRLAEAHGAQLEDLVLAITGGEPLEQVGFLRAWLPQAPTAVLLETAGIHSSALAEVLPWLRYVSLDAKDPADLRSGAEWNDFSACLQACSAEAATRPDERPLDFWTKFIVTANTTSSVAARAALRRRRAGAGGAGVSAAGHAAARCAATAASGYPVAAGLAGRPPGLGPPRPASDPPLA